MLCTCFCRAELSAAWRHGCPVVVLAPPGLALEALAAGEEPPLVPAAADLAAQQKEQVRPAP